MLSGFTEGASLAIVAQVAVQDRQRQGRHAPEPACSTSRASVGTLLWIALGAGAVPAVRCSGRSRSCPAKIAADVQHEPAHADLPRLQRASWDVQSRDREGTLQEIMTNQTSQATGGALQATSLLSTSLMFLILMGFAIALSPTAAGVDLRDRDRPCSRCCGRCASLGAGAAANCPGRRCATRARSPRPIGSPRRARCSGSRTPSTSASWLLVQRCRNSSIRTQLIAKAVPNIYQSLIFVLLDAGADGAELGRGRPRRRLLASCCCSCGPRSTVSRCRAPISLCSSRCRSSTACGKPRQRYTGERPGPRATRRSPGISTLAFDEVSFAYNPGRPVLSRDQLRGATSGEAIGIVGPSGAGKSTLVQILLQLRATRWPGRYLVNGRTCASSARRTGTGWSPTCPRNRGCCTPRSRRTSASSATSTTRRSSAPRGSRASTRTSSAGQGL